MKKYILLLCIGVLFILTSSMLVDDSNVLSFRITGAIICVSFVLISWSIIGYYLLRSEPKVKNENMSKKYNEVDMKEISKYGVDTKIFKKNIYQKFVDIQMALSNMDMDILKKYLTDDLYKDYVMELDDLKNEIKKIICKDIELVDIKIYNIEELYGVLHIDIYLNVRMVDYIDGDYDTININNKREFEFELNFIKKLDLNEVDSDYLLTKKSCVNIMEVKDIIEK